MRMFLMVVMVFAAWQPAAEAQDVTKAQVTAAIDRAVTYLKRAQQPDGSFAGRRFGRSYPQGVTAMACYALLLAGVRPDDPSVRKGLQYCIRYRTKKVYSAGLVALALAEAGPKYKEPLQKVSDWLRQAQLGSGMWSYSNSGQWGRGAAHRIGDNSNSQFGVLGLWAAARAGIKIDEATWKQIRDYWRGAQAADGSWGYTPRRGGRTAMTCAGIASLLIANAQLRRPGPK